jgi:16S rRNA C967 or C1407 C5-methylase (RsmB/RsmF family)
LRVKKKPSIQNLPLFKDGTIEVQDEGSQLLAQLVGARRGEMVADFALVPAVRHWHLARRCATQVVYTHLIFLRSVWRS